MHFTDSFVAGLLEGVLRTRDIEEACSLVVEQVGTIGGFERAALMLDAGPGVCGAARHLSYGSMLAVCSTLQESGPLFSELLHAVSRNTRPDLSGLPALEIETPIAIPCRNGVAPSFGVLVVDGPVPKQSCTLAARIMDRLAPALDLRRKADSHARAVDRMTAQTELQQRLIDTLSDAVVITDARNDIVLANNRAERLFTTLPLASEGRRRAIQVNNLLFSSFLTQGVIAGPGKGARELNLVDTEEGTDLLFEVISVPLGNGHDGRMISVLRDITDLKRAVSELEVQIRRSRVAEHAARQERDRLTTILGNVGEPILVTDEHGNIVLANRETERLFMPPDSREDPERMRSRTANDARLMALISRFLLRQDSRSIERLTVTDPDTRRTFPVEVVSSKILDVRGEPTATVNVLHDLTHAEENERLARELRQLNEQLEQRIRHATHELEERNRKLQWQSAELIKASQLKTEFLASMSHELRTPINVVLGYTSLLQERIYGELNPSQNDALERVHVTSQHLLELINDILDLSKIEAGMMPVNDTPVNVHLLVAELSQTIVPILTRKGLAFHVDIPDLPVIRTDRVKLKQVLLNLLSNATKFTPQGSVRLSASAGDGAIRIEIEDTGIGIREEHLEEIFDAFRQLDQSHTREFGGTGLGLSITRKLLQLLGGSIKVRSVVGSGSCFTVELPFQPLGPAEFALAERVRAPETSTLPPVFEFPRPSAGDP